MQLDQKHFILGDSEALRDFEMELITQVINDIYNSRYILNDLSKSISIALPKKEAA